MKPELKAMIDAAGFELSSPIDGSTPRADAILRVIRAAFLSSLHWRGDDLWAGPIEFGGVWLDEGDGEDDWCAGYGSQNIGAFKTKPEAKDSLEAAAKKQINEWFEEQAR